MSGYPTARAVSKTAGRDRILVDGKDVTDFRDKHTPFPGYLLTEPFAYGSTTLTFPQIHASLETLGSGELSWVRHGAEVRIQRVMPDTNVVTDYVGVVIAVNVNGRVLSLDVGGQFAGRASLQNKQQRLFRYVGDVGHLAQLCAQQAGIRMTPWFGPVTGIDAVDSGTGEPLLSWAQQLCALSQDETGVQRTLMPTTWGGSVWDFEEKDYTTKHFTLYTDDARVVASLADDVSEQPNVWYGTGTTPDGVRVRNGRYPGLVQGPAPVYPMAGNADFGAGTVNADTVDGGGISTLQIKLTEMGYMRYNVKPDDGIYDAVITAAVKRLQADVDLTVTGTMTLASWRRLFNIDETGFSLNGAIIFPFVESAAVRKWNYTTNGSHASKNAAYDPKVLRVERNIDFGANVDKTTMISYCRGQQARTGAKNWVGTIRLNNAGAFTGEHNGADAGTLTSADLMPLRDIRPGMNAWLPLFDGGTLVHVAGVQVDDTGATLTVDTQARDLMELREIIDRNRESRRDLRREWNAANRHGRPSGNMISRDEFFGQLSVHVDCPADKWTVFPVVVGQQGWVNRIWVQTINTEAEFAVLVTSDKTTRKRLDRRIGNPLTTGNKWWTRSGNRSWLRKRNLLYAAGTAEQPCGFWPDEMTDANGATGADVTGEWIDDSGFPYICDAFEPGVVWVAVYPDRDTTVKRGQILYAQEDDAL